MLRRVVGFSAVGLKVDGRDMIVLGADGDSITHNDEKLKLDPTGTNRITVENRHFGDELFIEMRLKSPLVKFQYDKEVTMLKRSLQSHEFVIDGKVFVLYGNVGTMSLSGQVQDTHQNYWLHPQNIKNATPGNLEVEFLDNAFRIPFVQTLELAVIPVITTVPEGFLVTGRRTVRI